ncbi:MAG TPA: hypothetical protein DCQ30_14745 [Acidimicrobiaceae bacterium]|nr:hypothetical protein [Acidimicrobiaceae bacterium]
MTPDGSPAGSAHTEDSAPGEGGWIGIEESARLLGAYAWVEGRLFDVLGALAADEPSDRLAVLLDSSSQEHAWHAELLAEHIPLLPGTSPDAFVTAPGPEAAEVLDRLGRLPGGAQRAAALARVVLPRLEAGYRRHFFRASPMSDGPVRRALRLVLSDEVEARLEMEEALEGLLSGVADRGGVLDEAARLAEPVAGWGPGFAPWPGGQGT